jgi:hypothetical protein
VQSTADPGVLPSDATAAFDVVGTHEKVLDVPPGEWLRSKGA